MAEAHYLRLPVIGKGGKHDWIYVEVDPRRYNLTVAGTFYRKVFKAEGTKDDYFPLNRNALPLERITVQPIEELITSEMQEVSGFVASTIGAGKVSSEILSVAKSIKDLLHAIVNHDQSGCEGSVRAMARQIGELTLELIAGQKRAEQDVETITELAASAASVAPPPESETLKDMYEAWAITALDLIQSCRRYKEQSAFVHALAEEAHQATAIAQVAFKNTDGIVHRTLAFLDSVEGSFISRMLMHKMAGTVSDESCVADIIEAERLMQECDELLAESKSTYARYRKDMQKVCGETYSAVTPRRLAEIACSDMGTHQQSLRALLGAHPNDQGPWAYDEALISKVDYEEALSYLPPMDGAAHDWYPGQCVQALRQSVQKLSVALSSECILPDELLTAMTNARSLIAEARKQKKSPSAIRISRPPVADLTSESPLQASPLPREQKPPAILLSASPSAPECDVDRIYELLVCVAYVCTFLNDHHMAAKTTRGMLRVVVALGLCTEEEADQCEPLLTERIKPLSEYVPDRNDMNARKQQSSQPWIHTSFHRGWTRRLTAVAANGAQRYMVKYGLTREQIVAANRESNQLYAQQRYIATPPSGTSES